MQFVCYTKSYSLLLFYLSGEVITDKVEEKSITEQSRSDSKGPDLYGGNATKAASNSQPPKSSLNHTNRDCCIELSEKATEPIMHPPVDYQQTPTHPHGTMTSVPIPFQPIHDYTGKQTICVLNLYLDSQ